MPVRGAIKKLSGSPRLRAAQNDFGSATQALEAAEKAHQEAHTRLVKALKAHARAEVRLEAVRAIVGAEEAQATLEAM